MHAYLSAFSSSGGRIKFAGEIVSLGCKMKSYVKSVNFSISNVYGGFVQGYLNTSMRLDNSYSLTLWIKYRANFYSGNITFTGARPKLEPTQDIILNPLLAYVHFSLQSGTSDSTKKAVLGFFPTEAIAEAKEVLHTNVNNDIIGTIQHRRNGDTRSRAMADIKDIIAAMLKIDSSSHTPIFAVPSYQLNIIPRSHPEELNNISVVDRLHELEQKWTRCQELIDQTVCENIALSERVGTLEKDSRPSYSAVTSRMSNLRLPLPTSHVASTAPSGVLAMNSEDLSSTGTKYPPTPLRPQFNEHTLLTKEHTGSAPLINQNANVRSFRKIPDHNLKHSASIDNIDNISMKSNTSGISGYQYQRQYRKQL